MNLLGNLKNIFWERNKAGENWYSEISESSGFGLNGTNLYIAQNHPILTPALLFVSKLFSQAQFYMINVKTGEKSLKSPVLEMLNNPNYYQTKMDLLESLMFMQIANGVSVLYKKTIIGLRNEVEAVYLLDYNLIKFPDDFKTPLSVKNKDNKVKDSTIVYDENGENLKIKIDDLYFFYDMPNALNVNNRYEAKSRLDGLRQTLVNTCDSLVAKNIILKTNGKEMITKGEGFPLGENEKEEAQKLLNNRFGLSSNRSRSLVSSSNLTWKSLHIAIRDLGLDESVKVDGNIIYTALHIPKDIISLEAKKTTYNNFKESMVSYIQNEVQSSLDAFCAVINTASSDKVWKLKGDYDHLPVMQFIMLERYDVVKKQAEALAALIAVGMPEDIALAMCGISTVIKLTPPKQEEPKTPTPT